LEQAHQFAFAIQLSQFSRHRRATVDEICGTVRRPFAGHLAQRPDQSTRSFSIDPNPRAIESARLGCKTDTLPYCTCVSVRASNRPVICGSAGRLAPGATPPANT